MDHGIERRKYTSLFQFFENAVYLFNLCRESVSLHYKKERICY